MSPGLWLTALLAGLAAWLALPVRRDLGLVETIAGAGHGDGEVDAASSPGWHLVLSGAAGLTAGMLVGSGPVGTCLVALVVGAGSWRLLTRSAGAGARRTHEVGLRELPHLVGLLAAGLRAGAAPPAALEAACVALPGPAADLLADVHPRLVWGADPAEVWADLAGDPALGPLGRTLSRAHETGASVADAVESLAIHLAAEGRAAVEDRARAVGVRAALPLGVCLLPAFLLLGIVPSVAGLVSQLALG